MTLVAEQVKRLARGLGFDLVGIAPAARSPRESYIRQWISSGRAGQMTYLADRIEERIDPAAFLPGARTIICVAMNYFAPLAAPDARQAAGKVARYALGADYHELIKPKLYAIADWLREAVPGTRTKCGVDTAPILEREHAARGGIGWVGKNTCLINERIGSWLLLGSVLTTADLAVDEPSTDRCGTCTRCIDACPTAAIVEPYQLDASKCISYLTIEHSGDIAEPLRGKMQHWLFGCDICQDVCPWNGRAPGTEIPELKPRLPAGTLNVDEVLAWSKDDFDRTFRHTAVKRIRLPVLQRNARIVKEQRPRISTTDREQE